MTSEFTEISNIGYLNKIFYSYFNDSLTKDEIFFYIMYKFALIRKISPVEIEYFNNNIYIKTPKIRFVDDKIRTYFPISKHYKAIDKVLNIGNPEFLQLIFLNKHRIIYILNQRNKMCENEARIILFIIKHINHSRHKYNLCKGKKYNFFKIRAINNYMNNIITNLVKEGLNNNLHISLNKKTNILSFTI